MATVHISPVGRLTFDGYNLKKPEKVPLGPDSFSAKVVWAEGFQPALAEFVTMAVAAAREKTEAEILRLLGMWVSELEPVICYDYNGYLIGLAPAGHADTLTLVAWS